MALPHMYSARAKNIFESAIVSRRNKENDFRDRWRETSNYFATNNTAADKKAAWESQKSFQSRFAFVHLKFFFNFNRDMTYFFFICLISIMFINSMNAYKALQDKDSKILALQARRKRLSDLLAEEQREYAVRIRFIIFTPV